MKKIAVTGPESTGKSMLSEALAAHFNTVWVPEYAREYIGGLQRPYTQDDILAIAKGQLEREAIGLSKASGILICDTELIVTRIWSEVKYGTCDPWILEQIGKNPYDLYLLCDIDLPWQDDPQREHPHLREYLFGLYHSELVSRRLPFAVISGLGPARLSNALRIIDRYNI